MSIEQSQIAAFLSTLDGGDFIALPPSRESVDQEERHDEARAVAARRGATNPSGVFWRHQSGWEFDAVGNLSSDLLLHWGGDHARILGAVSAIAVPFRVLDHGPGRAFKIVSDVAAQTAVVGWFTKAPDLSDEAIDHLVANWTSIYPKAPNWVLTADLLNQLHRRGDPRLATRWR